MGSQLYPTTHTHTHTEHLRGCSVTVDSKGGGAMGSALVVVVGGWWCTQEVARRRNQMVKVEAATACDAGRSGPLSRDRGFQQIFAGSDRRWRPRRICARRSRWRWIWVAMHQDVKALIRSERNRSTGRCGRRGGRGWRMWPRRWWWSGGSGRPMAADLGEGKGSSEGVRIWSLGLGYSERRFSCRFIPARDTFYYRFFAVPLGKLCIFPDGVITTPGIFKFLTASCGPVREIRNRH